MIYDYEKVTARTRQVVAGDPDYVYDRRDVPGTDHQSECFYYERVALLDGLPWPAEMDDDDLLGEIINHPDRVTFTRGAPSCLIGVVLDPWLTEAQRDYVFAVYNTETITNGLYDWLVGERVLVDDFMTAAWLRAAQEAQDRKEPWGECLVVADTMIREATRETVADMDAQIKELMGDRL